MARLTTRVDESLNALLTGIVDDADSVSSKSDVIRDGLKTELAQVVVQEQYTREEIRDLLEEVDDIDTEDEDLEEMVTELQESLMDHLPQQPAEEGDQESGGEVSTADSRNIDIRDESGRVRDQAVKRILEEAGIRPRVRGIAGAPVPRATVSFEAIGTPIADSGLDVAEGESDESAEESEAESAEPDADIEAEVESD